MRSRQEVIVEFVDLHFQCTHRRKSISSRAFDAEGSFIPTRIWSLRLASMPPFWRQFGLCTIRRSYRYIQRRQFGLDSSAEIVFCFVFPASSVWLRSSRVLVFLLLCLQFPLLLSFWSCASLGLADLDLVVWCPLRRSRLDHSGLGRKPIHLLLVRFRSGDIFGEFDSFGEFSLGWQPLCVDPVLVIRG